MTDDDMLQIGSAIYLLESSSNCWKCGTHQPVIAIATCHIDYDAPTVSERSLGDSGDDDLYILSNIEDAPEEILQCVRQVHSGFMKRWSHTAKQSYYMNVCSACDSNFGDFYLHSEPGEAFFPEDDQHASTISIRTLPLHGQFGIRSGYGVGAGFLILRNAKRIPW